ncbi:MAG: Na+/H+ antiporter subunit E [Verrucomicrobiota bacterium]
MSTSGIPASSAKRSWPLRAVGLVVFILKFTRELVLANIAIAKSVLFQKNADLAPGFITYPLKGLSHFEILVLTHSITLTPGTASVEISEDMSELVVHAFDARDPEAVRDSIKKGLEQPLLAWTR